MIVHALLDTNVLVYSVDRTEPAKQQRAKELLGYLAETGGGSVSTQVVAEFFSTVNPQSRVALTCESAELVVKEHLQIWKVFDLTPDVVRQAVQIARRRRISYWDAQIIATAALHRVTLLFTEDLDAGSVIEGVRVVNPFLPGF